MNNVNQGSDLVAMWRSGKGNSPAGALFIGGTYAEADIVNEIKITTTKTLSNNLAPTACTASPHSPCC